MAINDVRVELFKKNNNDNFDRLIVVTDIDSVEGLLNTNGKINYNLIPDTLLGAMIFQGILEKNTGSSGDGLEIVDTLIKSNTQKGWYWVARETGAGIFDNGEGIYKIVGKVFDDGDEVPINEIVLEQGDWLVVNSIDHTTKEVSFGIINNTYPDATTDIKGVVKLASAIDGNNTNVVTNKNLYDSLESLISTKHPVISGLNTTGNHNQFTVNSQGHITSATYKTASTSNEGFIGLANDDEAKGASDSSKAMTPSTTKKAVDYYGGIRYYSAKPTASTIAEGCIIAVAK